MNQKKKIEKEIKNKLAKERRGERTHCGALA